MLKHAGTPTPLMMQAAGGCRWAMRYVKHTRKTHRKSRRRENSRNHLSPSGGADWEATVQVASLSCEFNISARTGSAGSEESASALPSSIQTHAGNYLTLLRGLENVSGLEMEALSRIKYVVNQARKSEVEPLENTAGGDQSLGGSSAVKRKLRYRCDWFWHQ